MLNEKLNYPQLKGEKISSSVGSRLRITPALREKGGFKEKLIWDNRNTSPSPRPSPVKGEGGSHGSHQGGGRKSWIPSRGREEVMDPIK
ncbi:MAG TPA: hypothetical protein VJN91_01560, partial [Gammaproteobacteria bacterium]|nr:hypothetical protein [Gammaproteobacteria bacterium]